MNIRGILKKLDIKLTDFAEKLDISRPTLNNYIALFEKGEPLPNDKYEIVFGNLFNNEINSREQFLLTLNNFKGLLTRDKLLGTLEYDPQSTDLMTSILERMKKDLKDKDYDEDIYIFINMIIGSYRKERIFKDMTNYFLYLNGVKDCDKMNENEKNFSSNMYKLLYLYKGNRLETDKDYYSKFIKRINEIEEEKDQDKDSLKEQIFKDKIESQINELIEEQLNLGLDVEDIDVSNLMKKVNLSDLKN